MSIINKNIANKNINYSLNFLKCVAIFAVVCIHCGTFPIVGNKGLLIDAVSRFAVPVFFLISGFYSYYNDNSNVLDKYKRRIIKLIKLLIIGNILYFIYDLLILKDVFSLLLSKFDLYSIFYYVIYDISPFGPHLWFIFALIYCYVLFYILTKFSINPKILYKFVPILFAALLFMSEFSKLIGMAIPFEYYRNFLFMGLPFFMLGYYFHDKKDALVNLSNLLITALAIFGFLLTVFEALFFGKLDIFLGTLLFTIFVFIWCVKNPNKLNFKITEFIGGKLYTSMYILHVLVLMLLLPIIQAWLFVACFVVTAIISAIIHIITSKLNIKL